MKASAWLLLLVLALALVSAPLTAEAQKKEKKKDDDDDLGRSFNCSTLCEGRKSKNRFVICRDSCELSNRITEMSLARIQCGQKCMQQKGPAIKVCQEQCEKAYKGKAGQIAAACNKTCDLEEYSMTLRDGCRSLCTPPA